ncbi:SGNH/GDSL hydrolase family protein [Ferrimonas senticii]|uniref:SGNH/GDSL hydrolase family protein n=1 Tax=Ferrimonas senticii TaxID=394566 RepID=UPI00042758B7|nr:SGNH/GDSL hydrolase family protein [Ferrimonas senticii]
MPDATTLMLAPLLITQGKWLRWRLPKLAEASGKRYGHCGNGKPLSILVFGDSAAAGVGVEQQSQALTGQLLAKLQRHYQIDWQLVAQSGLKTAESLTFIEQVNAKQVDVVVISLGVNDAKSTGSPQQWLAELEKVVAALNAKVNPKLVLIAKVPPMGLFPRFPQPLRWWLGWRSDLFNQQLQQWAQQQSRIQLTEIPADGADLAIDGLHPGANTYRLWAQQATEQIVQSLPPC